MKQLSHTSEVQLVETVIPGSQFQPFSSSRTDQSNLQYLFFDEQKYEEKNKPTVAAPAAKSFKEQQKFYAQGSHCTFRNNMSNFFMVRTALTNVRLVGEHGPIH